MIETSSFSVRLCLPEVVVSGGGEVEDERWRRKTKRAYLNVEHEARVTRDHAIVDSRPLPQDSHVVPLCL